jgi:hypothetical protein
MALQDPALMAAPGPHTAPLTAATFAVLLWVPPTAMTDPEAA